MGLLLSLIIGLQVSGPGLAHKYYAALTRIDYNAKSGTFEVVHRFFAHDLELALGQRAGREVSVSDLQDAEALAGPLFVQGFTLAANGAPVALEFWGIEVDGDFAWAYFEGPAAAPPERLTITNRLLIDSFPDQINTVTADINGRVRSANFDKATHNAVLVFTAAPDPD